jgi:MFS family permease
MTAEARTSTRFRSPGWALAVLAAISTCGFIDRIIMQVLVEPIKIEFDLSDTQIGLVTGLAFAVLNVGLGLWVARIAERRRRVTLVWIGTLLWSAATALCGAAGNFMQLVCARIGVGVGEAIGLPSTSSIVSDLYPREKRTTAMAVLMLAPPLGAFLGSAAGATIAQAYGWRAAFWVAAAPGVVLALLLAFTVTEPPRGRFDKMHGDVDRVPPFSEVLGRMWGLRSLRHMILGSMTASLAGFGVNVFLAAFLLRRFGFTVGEAGLIAGLIASLPASVSVFGAGWLADRLGAKSPASYGLVPAIGLIAAAPVYMLAVTRETAGPAIALLIVAAFLQYCYLAPSAGVVQNMMHPRMRASAAAVTSLITSLISASLGPLIVGALSDTFSAAFPLAAPGYALSTALATTATAYAWAAVHYAIASRHLPAEFNHASPGEVTAKEPIELNTARHDI